MIVWYITEDGYVSSGILPKQYISEGTNVIIPFFTRTENFITVDRVFKSKTKARAYLEELKSKEPAHWEDCSNGWSCSNCHRDNTDDIAYCPHCGKEMSNSSEAIRKKRTEKEYKDMMSDYYDVESREYRIPFSVIKECMEEENGNNKE